MRGLSVESAKVQLGLKSTYSEAETEWLEPTQLAEPTWVR